MRSLLLLFGPLLLLPACTARTGGSVHAQDPEAAAVDVAPRVVGEPATSPDANGAASIDAWPVPERTAAGYAPAVRWGERELPCNGTGLCEWGIFGIDLYDAALYLERRAGDLAAASEPDQRYVLHLLHECSGGAAVRRGADHGAGRAAEDDSEETVEPKARGGEHAGLSGDRLVSSFGAGIVEGD